VLTTTATDCESTAHVEDANGTSINANTRNKNDDKEYGYYCMYIYMNTYVYGLYSC
jgi:hypothetical protein